MKKILLIEDNESLRENTAEILELANYKVITARNGKEGVEKALYENPDLIICDIMMPVLDGYGVIHMLQKNSITKNTGFIFLSAKTERTEIRKGMELGADDYITKPFDSTELLHAVECRLKKLDLRKEEINTQLDNARQMLENENPDEQLQEFTSGRDINRYKKKQLIFSEGNRPTCLYYIKKGKVKVYKSNEDGKGLVMDLYHEGDFLGHIALIENSNYKETAEAMEETELAVIPKEDFDLLIHTNPQISYKFIQLLAKDITEKENHLLGLAYDSLRKKVADALITISHKFNEQNNDQFSIHLSRENLAAIAGTATESLIRTLGDFKSENLIDIREGIITIKNIKKLETLHN